MPRQVDPTQRDREIRAATLRVIARHGVGGVTIRGVAAELGTSTTAITHYVATREALLEQAIGQAMEARRKQLDEIVAGAEDPLWAAILWSVDADPDGLWPVLVAARAAGIEPVVTRLIHEFDEWWTRLITDLAGGRAASDLSPPEVADAIGVVVDGLLLGYGEGSWSPGHRHHLARMLVRPLLAV
jgi:AcrR family transcriptional regulator